MLSILGLNRFIVAFLPQDFLLGTNYSSIGYNNFIGISKYYEFISILLPIALVFAFILILRIINEYKNN
jgi:hypothetical protein